MQKAKNPMTDDEELKIKKIFNKYDKNGDGWISRGEWYDVVFKFLGDRDSAWILAEVPEHTVHVFNACGGGIHVLLFLLADWWK